MPSPTTTDTSTDNRREPVAFIEVLGGLTLRGSAGEKIELKAKKSRQLLAYLAMTEGHARTRDYLATLLWSDRLEEQARGSLRTALSQIRRAFGDDVLLVERDAIRLSPGSIQSDFGQLRKLAEKVATFPI